MVASSRSSLSLMHAVRQTISEFSENTSIHGVRYIAENGRRWVERFLWIATEVVCVGCAVYMLMYLLSKFNTNPTMTRVESYFYDVAEVPFPAITLCNVNRIFRSRAERLVDSLRIPEGAPPMTRDDMLALLPLLGQLLAIVDLGSGITRRGRLDRLLRYNNLSAVKVFEELGQPCKELIERCSWQGQEVDCNTIFTKTMTYLGFCCSFNAMRDFSEPPSSADPKPPLKTAFFGYPLGLTVLLNPHTEDYFWGPFSSAGVVCAVHDSNAIATERASQAMVSIERESMVQVLPSIRNASEALHTVSPQRRRCLFESENPMGSEEYSYDDCTIECEAAKLWRVCNCRPINFPRIHGPRGTICSLSKQLVCLLKFHEDQQDAMAKAQIPGSKIPTEPVDAEKVSEEKYQACGCLAQCNSVSYDLETTTANFGASETVRRDFYHNMNATARSLLHVYFDSQTSAFYINDLVSNAVQLMSSLGGIFSLFLGCSFMSAIEVIYFFTVRLWLVVRGDGELPRDMPVVTPGPPGLATISPPYLSPAADLSSKSFTKRPREEHWGWGSDKPLRPRVF